MLPFKLIYHPDYDFQLGPHVFPSVKYRLIRERLLEDGFADEDDFIQPGAALDDDLGLAHTREWVGRLRAGRLSAEEARRMEIPYTDSVVRGFWLAAGGSILAARLALRDGVGFNIGGGFHHACPGHGEGFCAINDVAVAVRKLQAEGSIRSAMVVDVDVHHGNGTAAIFAGDASVFTLSIHQFNNYPADKPPSTLDVHLEDGVADDEYLARLRAAYVPALRNFRPELLVYLAGADPHWTDQLGGLLLTTDGLMRRDRLVLGHALAEGVPVAVVLAGGYAQDVRDTVTIHCNTAKACADGLALHPWTPRPQSSGI